MNQPTRGSRADGKATRAKILEHAGQLFAQSGYAETTSQAIAQSTGVDLAAINYHFGSRDALYQVVLAEGHRRFFDMHDLRALARVDLTPRNKLGLFLHVLMERFIDHPDWHLRVYARELLAPSSHLQVLIDTEAVPKLQLLMGILHDITGIALDDPALVRCLVSVMAPCLMAAIAGQNFPGPAGQLAKMSAVTLATHFVRFSLGGLDAMRVSPLHG